MARAPVVDIQQRGVPEATRELRQVGERGSDMRRIGGKVRTVYRGATQRQFESKSGWPPLAGSTKERKARDGLDPRPLRATGALYRSMTASSAADQIDVREPDELRFGTTVPYAQFHEYGRGVPQRKLLVISPADEIEIERILAAYIIQGRSW